MAKLESLVVDLQLETAELKKGLDEIKEKLKETADSTEGLFNFEVLKEVGEIAFEAAAKMGEFVLSGAEAADKMGKLAAAAQVPVETFERLAYASKLGGVSAEDLGGSFNKLNKALGEAAMGSTKQVALFSALKVSLKDASGAGRSSADIFKELATKLSEMAPGYAKATLEQQLFGKSGTQLDEALKNVAHGMADAGGEADKLGLVLSGPAIAAATEFHDNFERIKMAVQGVGERVAAELSPALAELTGQLLHSADGAKLLQASVDVLVFGARVLISTVVLAIDAFALLNKTQQLTAMGFEALATGDFASFGAIVTGGIDLIETDLTSLKDRLKTVWSENEGTFKEAGEAHKKMADGVLSDIERMAKASQEMEARFREAKALAEKLTTEHIGETNAQEKRVEIRRGAQTERSSFNDIGASQGDVFARLTKGFENFDQALNAATTAQIKVNDLQATADQAKRELNVAGYDEAIQALLHQKELGRHAREAADAFKSAASELKKEIDKMSAGIGAAANHMISKLGDLGQVVSSAIQGFQQGGWWGAIVAVIIELFSRFKRFAEIEGNANAQLAALIDQLGPALSSLTDGFEKLQNSLGKMTQTVGTALSPVLDEVGRILGSVGDLLGPIFGAIEQIIEPVTNILHLFTGLAAVLDPLQWVIKLVGALFTLVAISFLEISNVLQTALSSVFRALLDFLNSVGLSGSDASKTMFDLAVTFQNGALAAQHKAEGMWAQLGDEFSHFFEDGTSPKKNTNINTDVGGGAKAATDGLNGLGAATNKTSAAMQKLTEQFTNLPQGFKVRLRTLQAADAVGFNPDDMHGRGDVHIHAPGGLTTTVDQLIQLFKIGLDRSNFRQKGF